ncbi:MAG: hypothetical protein ACM3SY_16985 [Candidatus Omnitrophota bacterium]
MIKWNDFYDRPAYFEGVRSAFDLFGVGSSFRRRASVSGINHYTREHMYQSFNKTGTFLSHAMRLFGKTFGDDKFKRNK